jgi:hypothetical protein
MASTDWTKRPSRMASSTFWKGKKSIGLGELCSPNPVKDCHPSSSKGQGFLAWHCYNSARCFNHMSSMVQ